MSKKSRVEIPVQELTIERSITQYPAVIYERKLGSIKDAGISLLAFEKLIEGSRLKSWASIEEVYECREHTTEKIEVNIFIKAKKATGLTGFRQVPGLEFLIPVKSVNEELLKFLGGQLR